jgi:hypothetical protein
MPRLSSPQNRLRNSVAPKHVVRPPSPADRLTTEDTKVHKGKGTSVESVPIRGRFTALANSKVSAPA